MTDATLSSALVWVETIRDRGQEVEVVLHGGEPLLAGIAWYKRALGLMRASFGGAVRISLQSNLWLLDEAFCELFAEYGVTLGTSLDGPELINDAQRGKGCFSKTMHGIDVIRRRGGSVGVICTFTRQSSERWREVFDFFLQEGLLFSFHSATPRIDDQSTQAFALSPDAYARLFMRMFDYYLTKIQSIQIPTFDQIARSLTGQCGVCTFSPCLGHYLSVSCEGGIYPCNRFAAHPAWQLGIVGENPTLHDLSKTSAWQRLQRRESELPRDCGECPYFTVCSGGCAYHSLACGVDNRDGYCDSYKRIFAHVTEKVLGQVFSHENLTSVAQEGAGDHRGLYHTGSLLQLIRGGPHPSSKMAGAREALAAVALAASSSPSSALERLNRAGVVANSSRACASLDRLWHRVRRLALNRNEAYVHITYGCNLACTHCYAVSSPKRSAEAMSPAQVEAIIDSLMFYSFRRIKVTGGEPLSHPDWAEILELLAKLRVAKHSSKLVLRTNLAVPLSPSEMEKLGESFDHIIVSVDGDQHTHDSRRGVGTYARTVGNLRVLSEVCSVTPLTLAATLSDEQAMGQAGRSVAALAAELRCEVRFRPLVPIGRARASLPIKEARTHPSDVKDVLSGFHAVNSCSLGQNLHFEVNGDCYPCFALLGEKNRLGNAFQDGLKSIMDRNAVYSACTVDTNWRCRDCVWRYLCGGSCRIGSTSGDPNEAPHDCSLLERRAEFVLRSALDTLNVDRDAWRAAGLPDLINSVDVVV